MSKKDVSTTRHELNALIDQREIKAIEVIPYTLEDVQAYGFEDHHLGLPEELLVLLFKSCHGILQNLSTASDTEVDHQTRWILMLVPDQHTAINARKRRLEHTGTWSDEIYVLNLLLDIRRNAKSSMLWHHRMWTLNHLYGDEWPEHVIESELQMVTNACRLYRKNYYAWVHRQRVFDKLCATSFSGLSKEIEYAMRLMCLSPSDHSAMTYVQHVVSKRILGGDHDVLSKMKSTLLDALGLYSDHESLWIQVRYFAYVLDNHPKLMLNLPDFGLLKSLNDLQIPRSEHSVFCMLWIMKYTSLIQNEESENMLQAIKQSISQVSNKDHDILLLKIKLTEQRLF